MTNTATTKKIVTIVDKATKGINAAVTTASKVIADLQLMVSVSEDLAFDIETSSNKLAAIETDTIAGLRDAKADLAIKVKENADLVLTNLLKSANLARISSSDLVDLRNELSDAEDDNKAEIGKAVGIAVSKEAAAGALALSEATSKAAIASAETKAQVTALTQKAIFLESTIATLEKNAEAERAARVSIAATTAAPTVNVSSGK